MGGAHQSSSRLVAETLPLTGEVGVAGATGMALTMQADVVGCGLVLQTHDRVGNRCTTGGAKIRISNYDLLTGRTDNEAQADCVDNEDGTYSISWTSKVRGAFEAKVFINNEQVLGSPVRIELTSTKPEIARTLVSGPGLKSAVAGEPTQILLKFIDFFGNACTPDDSFTVGLALAEGGKVNSKMKLSELQLHGNFSVTWRNAALARWKLLIFHPWPHTASCTSVDSDQHSKRR